MRSILLKLLVSILLTGIPAACVDDGDDSQQAQMTVAQADSSAADDAGSAAGENGNEDTAVEEEGNMSLQERYDEKINAGKDRPPNPERDAVFKSQADALLEDGIAERALNVGDEVPDVLLTHPNGMSTSLKQILRAGPILLQFYRGNW